MIIVGEINSCGDPIPDGMATTFGKTLILALLGTPEFKDGRMVAFHLDQFDYAAVGRERDGETQVCYFSRTVGDKSNPNWPEPA